MQAFGRMERRGIDVKWQSNLQKMAGNFCRRRRQEIIEEGVKKAGKQRGKQKKTTGNYVIQTTCTELQEVATKKVK